MRVSTRVVKTVDVVYADAVNITEGLLVSGQIVVETAIDSVVVCPTGQLVIVGAQLVTIYTDVVYMVKIVEPYDTMPELTFEEGLEVDSLDAGVEGVLCSDSPDFKEIEGIP